MNTDVEDIELMDQCFGSVYDSFLCSSLAQNRQNLPQYKIPPHPHPVLTISKYAA